MVRMAINVLTTIGLLIATQAARAMEFTFDPLKTKADNGSIVAVGVVQPGDEEKLHRLVAGLPGKSILIGLTLSSPGGDLLEGLRLATTIRNSRLPTAVVDVCASACFLMFAAGTRRVASSDARIGVHSISYRGAEITESQRAVTTKIAHKAMELNVPLAIVAILEATPADDMAWLSRDDLESMNVGLVNTRVAEYEPNSAFWFGANKAGASNAASALLTSTGPSKAEAVRDSSPPNSNPVITAGRQARIDYEAWFSGLKGDIRSGAEWWAGVRSHASRDRLTCETGTPLSVTGCKQAQTILSPSDDRRRTEPDFRAGWNSLQSQ